MKLATTLTLAALLLMPACTGSKGVGALRIEPLPATVAKTCRHPSSFLGAGDWELIAGRLGDELITCNARRGAAVDAYSDVRKALQ
jgi:hypothetical protein